MFMTPVVCEPLAALAPLQLPVALQVGLLVALQVMVLLPPAVIEVGLTDIETTGTAMTVRVADFVSVPALLLQARVYVYVPAVDMVPVLCDPLPLFAPDQLPLAVQLVGLLVALQLKVELLPVPMLLGETEMVTTGATAPPPPLVTFTVAVAVSLPPALLQSSV